MSHQAAEGATRRHRFTSRLTLRTWRSRTIISDHTANANDFAGSTWLVRQEERDAMFAEKPAGIIATASSSGPEELQDHHYTDRRLRVFGDGTVIIKSAPGHTPGHQEERTTGKVPTFEFNKDNPSSRAAIEDFLKKTKAQIWIEHDGATFATLKKAGAYYE